MVFWWRFGGPLTADYQVARFLTLRAGKRRIQWGLVPLAVERYGSQLLQAVRKRQEEEKERVVIYTFCDTSGRLIPVRCADLVKATDLARECGLLLLRVKENFTPLSDFREEEW